MSLIHVVPRQLYSQTVWNQNKYPDRSIMMSTPASTPAHSAEQPQWYDTKDPSDAMTAMQAASTVISG